MLEPARENKILDLVLSNDPLVVIDLTVSLPFSTTDHSPLSWSLWSLEPNRSTNTLTQSFNFTKADYDDLRAYLSTIN